jgi:radical SAM superfamily enzyme
MYIYDLPALVFVIKVGCVFCEVQTEAEETVEHQASVMIDCKTVARCGENFQCLFRYVSFS